MVRDVPGNRVRQRIYGNRIPAGDTAARPSVIRQIADHRSREKSDPQYYARLTVTKALAAIGKPSTESIASTTSQKQEDRAERD